MIYGAQRFMTGAVHYIPEVAAYLSEYWSPSPPNLTYVCPPRSTVNYSLSRALALSLSPSEKKGSFWAGRGATA